MLKRLIKTATNVAIAAAAGWAVGIPVLATVGAIATGGIMGALALLTNPGCITFAMLMGAISFSSFTSACPCESTQKVWVVAREI